jgi:hypothetical protein
MKRKIKWISVCSILLATIALSAPCYGQLILEVSPNIINIDSNRYGDIRIYTNLRYADFKSSVVFIAVNDSPPIEDGMITKTSDSLGNLILKFGLGELQAIESHLNIDDYNDFRVGIEKDGVSLEGYDYGVYIIDKKIK